MQVILLLNLFNWNIKSKQVDAIQITFKLHYGSTVVEQAVECAPVTQRVQVVSPVETSLLGEVFGVFPHL